MSEAPPPQLRRQTIRDALEAELRDGWRTTRELSGAVGVAEAAVPEHLEHLRKSLERGRERFEVDPPQCLACGFCFRERNRLTKPSRCPQCRSERIRPPRYRVA